MNVSMYLFYYLLAFNLAGFALCGLDKRRARKRRWRISESALLTVGLCGGCFGLLFGMGVFRHKTKHIKFKLLAPAECVLWGTIIVLTIKRYF